MNWQRIANYRRAKVRDIMNKYLLLYRSGDTFKKTYSEEEQLDISKSWTLWIQSLGDKFIENSPLTRTGMVVSESGSESLEINEDLVNGYVLLYGESLEEMEDVCRRCPLYSCGKVFEIRQLPEE